MQPLKGGLLADLDENMDKGGEDSQMSKPSTEATNQVRKMPKFPYKTKRKRITAMFSSGYQYG